MLLIPEFELMRAITCGIEFLRSNLLENSADETKSVLYKNFGSDITHNTITFENTSFFQQVKKLIAKDSRRGINISLGYSTEKLEIPTYHIVLNEEGEAPGSGLGSNEGYVFESNGNYDIDTNTLTYRPRYAHQRECMYDIIITSNSNFELILMSHLLETLITGMLDHLSLKGAQNIQYAIKSLDIDPNILPLPVYHRKFAIKFEQDKIGSSFFTYPVFPNVPLDIKIGEVTIESVN
jgi:hypothetical protein